MWWETGGSDDVSAMLEQELAYPPRVTIQLHDVDDLTLPQHEHAEVSKRLLHSVPSQFAANRGHSDSRSAVLYAGLSVPDHLQVPR